jgi:antitoxin (DNA-binding transcriptional repressor) of toxin-antitoxin stability system
MKRIAISVTEAARNFADCINRARYQDVTFVLLKNGSPVAQLVPNKEKVCTGSDLAAILKTARLTDKESKVWRRDRQASRKTLKDAIVRRINPSVCAVGRTSAASGHERNQVAG